MVSFSLGYRVDINKWIPDAQRCKSKTTHGEEKIPAFEINKSIELFENTVHEIFYNYEVKDKVPTTGEFKADVNIALFGESANLDLLQDRFYEYILDCKNCKGLSTNRIKSLKQTMRHLNRFNPSIRMYEFDDMEMREFINYLAQFQYRNSTISKHYDNTRSFILWCIENKIYNGDAL